MYRVVFFNCSYPKFSKYKKKTKYRNCSYPKISKYKKKTKYPNCSYPKFSKYKKKIKYLNCSHPKISECGKVKILKQTNKKHRIFNSNKTLLLVLCASVINLFNVHV